MSPQRIQLSRRKGWRKPESAVVVARPTKWGNPWRWQDNAKWTPEHLPDGELDDEPRRIPDAERRRWAVVYFESAIRYGIGRPPGYPSVEEIRAQLGGRDLACWCPLPAEGEPDHCHAAVLLELANGGEV